jgi:hypothetical protein
LIAPVLLLFNFADPPADPPTTAGLGPRWRTLLSDGLSVVAVDRTVPGGRTGMALLAVSFWINLPFAAAPDLPEPS